MSLHISSIELENFKKFPAVDTKLHSNLCVFVGDNGGGKTSILEAISILISSIFPLCHYVPRISPMPLSSGYIRTWYNKTKKGLKLTYAESCSLKCRLKADEKDEKESEISILAKKTGTRRSLTLGPYIMEPLRNPQDSRAGIPTFAYYGAHRGAAQGDRKRFGRKKVDYTNSCASYINALKPSLDFDLFLEWFSEQEHSEFIINKRKKGFISKELDTVRRAISKIFETSPIRYSEPHFEANPKRFALMQESELGEVLPLPFDNLSDGYRAMIALVADFARRLAIANQNADIDPLLGDGILLIDEIDAHLHPKWQYRVIDDLRRTFPNVQLIVTTHSAEVVSTVPKESVYLLDSTDGDEVITQPNEQTEGDSPDYISSSIMKTPEAYRKAPAYQAFLRCLAFIQEDKVDAPEFSELKEQVIKHYGEAHHITKTMEARLKGLESKKTLMMKLRKR